MIFHIMNSSKASQKSKINLISSFIPFPITSTNPINHNAITKTTATWQQNC
jgi:hypothetical protein